ncbi:MAG: hypothetical protein AAGG69_12830 [Pseudomonadota bacterium]
MRKVEHDKNERALREAAEFRERFRLFETVLKTRAMLAVAGFADEIENEPFEQLINKLEAKILQRAAENTNESVSRTKFSEHNRSPTISGP